jgi:hypothetical protein
VEEIAAGKSISRSVAKVAIQSHFRIEDERRGRIKRNLSDLSVPILTPPIALTPVARPPLPLRPISPHWRPSLGTMPDGSPISMDFRAGMGMHQQRDLVFIDLDTKKNIEVK